jgi:hypothetical protein
VSFILSDIGPRFNKKLIRARKNLVVVNRF